MIDLVKTQPFVVFIFFKKNRTWPWPETRPYDLNSDSALNSELGSGFSTMIGTASLSTGTAFPFFSCENTKFILKFQKANPARPIYTLNTLSSFLTGSHLWFRHQQNPPWKSQNYAPLRCISHPRHPQPMRIASSRTSRENLSGFASPLSILPFILYPYNYTQIIFQQFQSSTNHVSCLDCWNFIGKVLRSLDYFTRGRHTTCLINRPHGSSQWH